MFLYSVDTNKCTSSLPGCAMLIVYSLLVRPGEVGHQPKSGEKNLTWHPNFEPPQEISIQKDASKTNRW